MTARRYRKTDCTSRSNRTRRPPQLRDHYAEADPPGNNDAHPVDILVDNLPEIVARRRKLTKMVKDVQRQVPDQMAFIKLMDAKFEYTTRREQLYFDVGYERGHFAGLAESSAATGTSDPGVREFQRQLFLAVASAKLPKHKTAAALLDVARAVVLASRKR